MEPPTVPHEVQPLAKARTLTDYFAPRSATQDDQLTDGALASILRKMSHTEENSQTKRLGSSYDAILSKVFRPCIDFSDFDIQMLCKSQPAQHSRDLICQAIDLRTCT